MTEEHVTSAEAIAAGPEEVWAAITTASGSEAWSFRADVEPNEGGAVRLHRGPFAPDAAATVTAWEPPRRFAYEEPPSATEYLVEARDRGSCVVRVVSTFPGGTEWDDLAEEAGNGWRMSLLVLRAYVTHFAGLRSARLDLTAPVDAPVSARAEVGAVVATSLGVGGLTAGEEFHNALADGTVEHLGPYFTLLRATRPCPALFAISSFPMDAVTLSVNVTGRLYGADAEAVATRERPRWQDWLTRLTTQ
ncbi:SRPBCC domain-containing protein [Actinophytocola oryzae]|uniref:Activator of Hsp90 ATPase-like protein n=1 Tax=Actinophytocola oryzae TaxID=502181 RepID=A0A4R7VFK0_9PSEU|nr:SRPBCC domain-containing protein [Actinophytocola oryzae]TDV47819.1 activator of Hsp90 ATPase-like protein [Actinophytocola oryzae]